MQRGNGGVCKTYLKIYSRAWKIKDRSMSQVCLFNACSKASASSHALTAKCALSISAIFLSLRILIHPCQRRKALSKSAHIVCFPDDECGDLVTDSPENSKAYCEVLVDLQFNRASALTFAGSVINRSKLCDRWAIVYELWPAATIIELQQRRRMDSFLISPSPQESSHAGVLPHIGAWSTTYGQCAAKVIDLQLHPAASSTTEGISVEQLGPVLKLEGTDSGNQGPCSRCVCWITRVVFVTTGTEPGGKRLVSGSSASTKVRERLRMIESNMRREDFDLSPLWRGCAQVSNRARS
jgi:hypothetical protein